MKKKTVIILGLAAVAGLVYFIYPKVAKNSPAGNKPAQQNTQAVGRRVLPVDTYVVKSHGVTDVYPVNSFFLPSEEVDLCFEASGRITGILFKEGTFVEKDRLLAKVNDAKLQAQLRKLQAQLDLYNSKEFRQKSLLAQDAISQETYDESNTLVEATLADIELVKAQIRETELRAPFDGFIGLRQVSEGAYANPTTVVARLTKISPLKMELSIPEKYIDMVKAGDMILFTVDGDTLQRKAEVYATDSKIDKTTLSLTIRAYYTNLDRKIPPGRSAHVILQLNYDGKGISVPSESVVPDLGEHVVYKVENSRAKKMQIEPGVRTESYVQILKGLDVGDTVVTTGILQLRDGIDLQISSVR
ncbi:MAG: efflux RND transporter periplasmic adaptor subunit [Prevotellaceae bacterium]|jgi:membrane fusion protein (multidrug efflux system)|nr:efflux RND transporter periplasmic adaptor subunit [Prevotellaceae bacterium]